MVSDLFKAKIQRMRPRFLPNHPQKTLSEVDLREIEQQIGHALPSQYRIFLTYYGGIYFLSGAGSDIPGEIGEAGTGLFYGKQPGHADDLLYNFQSYRGRIPGDLLPIADDGGGNQICIGLTGERFGKIFYWDHNGEGLPQEYIDYNAPVGYHNVHPVADSFDAFFFSIEEEPEEEE